MILTSILNSISLGLSRYSGPLCVMSAFGRFCSLIPGLGVKLFTIILAGPTVLSAVGAALRMIG